MSSAPTASDNTKGKGAAGEATKSRGWNKALVNFYLDVALLINFMVLVVFAVIIRGIFPAPALSEGWTLWGLDYGHWMHMQFVTLAVLALGILLHVMLHWNWVCGVIANRWLDKSSTFRTDDGVKTLWGVALISLLFFIVAGVGVVATLMIHDPSR